MTTQDKPEKALNNNTAKASKDYTARDIQVLGGREAVRRRPGMYIGSTDQRGIHHLVYEIAYNAIDEAMAGFCTRVSITLNEDGSVSVEDNGRGIPVDIHPTTKVSAMQTVFTTLHAGAKFGGQIYKVSGGLHGVGASVVNALSSWLCCQVRRDGTMYKIEFRKGVPQGPVSQVGKAADTGTTVTFIPDEEIFGEYTFDFGILSDRVREMAYLNKGLEITIRDEKKDKELTFYFEGGINSFVRHLNRNREVAHPRPIHIYRQVDSSLVEAACEGGSYRRHKRQAPGAAV